MNVYSGLTGKVEKVPDAESTGAFAETRENAFIPPMGESQRPPNRTGILKGLGGLFSRVLDSKPELEDLLLAGVLYLLYRESGDIEFLLIAGAMLLM